jgi:hypothetical protein
MRWARYRFLRHSLKINVQPSRRPGWSCYNFASKWPLLYQMAAISSVSVFRGLPEPPMRPRSCFLAALGEMPRRSRMIQGEGVRRPGSAEGWLALRALCPVGGQPYLPTGFPARLEIQVSQSGPLRRSDATLPYTNLVCARKFCQRGLRF